MNRDSKELNSTIQLRLLMVVCFTLSAVEFNSSVQAVNANEWNLRDANHYQLYLPQVENLEQWERRKAEIREKLLITNGLWPFPKKSPLHAKVFDEKRGDGFKVSKVYFESLPGFFATGNLYEPTAGCGPFPAILSPHGHWQYGRLQNGESGSIPGRCIDFARQGFVVLSLDMVGYNDSFQLPHDSNKSRAQLKADKPLPYEPNRFRAEFDFPRAELYGFNLAGLQLWNSIRAIDFLCSQPTVDPERIGVTGASGGATQTILVMTADERVKVAAPVNIIGAEKHPGCLCENPNGLWIDISTVEMSAAFSPGPLLLMSATEDPWTHSTPQREFPLIQKYYALYGAQEKLANVHIAAGHNYNAETRAAVYRWFCHHLSPDSRPIEHPVSVSPELEALGDLRVFPDKLLPEGAISGWRVIRNWIKASEEAFQSSLPVSADSFPGFAQRFREALELVLSAQTPEVRLLSSQIKFRETRGDLSYQVIEINRSQEGVEWLEVETVEGNQPVAGNALLVCPAQMGGLIDPTSRDVEKVSNSLLEKGFRLFRVRGYASGHERILLKIWENYSWPNAYNLNNEQRSIRDIRTGLDYIAQVHPGQNLTVVGLGACGLEAAFACALDGRAERVILDLNGRDPGYDGELLELMPVGAIKRVGDFRTAVLLLMRKKVVLYDAGPTFDQQWYLTQAKALGFTENLEFRESLSAVGL